MHTVVAWEILPALQFRADEIERALLAELKPYSWVRPLKHPFYIVKIGSESERGKLFEKLNDVAKRYSSEMYFFIGPSIPSTRYNGWLPREMWDNINKRTD